MHERGAHGRGRGRAHLRGRVAVRGASERGEGMEHGDVAAAKSRGAERASTRTRSDRGGTLIRGHPGWVDISLAVQSRDESVRAISIHVRTHRPCGDTDADCESALLGFHGQDDTGMGDRKRAVRANVGRPHERGDGSSVLGLISTVVFIGRHREDLGRERSRSAGVGVYVSGGGGYSQRDFDRRTEDVWVHRQGRKASAPGFTQRQHGPPLRLTDVHGARAAVFEGRSACSASGAELSGVHRRQQRRGEGVELDGCSSGGSGRVARSGVLAA